MGVIYMAAKRKRRKAKKQEFTDGQREAFVVQPENAVNETSPVYQIQRDREADNE